VPNAVEVKKRQPQITRIILIGTNTQILQAAEKVTTIHEIT
jgi:hypothetical protein